LIVGRIAEDVGAAASERAARIEGAVAGDAAIAFFIGADAAQDTLIQFLLGSGVNRSDGVAIERGVVHAQASRDRVVAGAMIPRQNDLGSLLGG
jgi:hypothetical protein